MTKFLFSAPLKQSGTTTEESVGDASSGPARPHHSSSSKGEFATRKCSAIKGKIEHSAMKNHLPDAPLRRPVEGVEKFHWITNKNPLK
jgi:hypothetical protein